MVGDLKKKLKLDPSRILEYESEIWDRCKRISELNRLYLLEKEQITPQVKNAFITFRSQEGKQRALRAYSIPWHRKLCCKNQYNKVLLDMETFPELQDPVDPALVLWHNYGLKTKHKVFYYLKLYGVIAVFLIISGTGHAYFHYVDRIFAQMQNFEVRNSCFQRSTSISAQMAVEAKNDPAVMSCYCVHNKNR